MKFILISFCLLTSVCQARGFEGDFFPLKEGNISFEIAEQFYNRIVKILKDSEVPGKTHRKDDKNLTLLKAYISSIEIIGLNKEHAYTIYYPHLALYVDPK